MEESRGCDQLGEWCASGVTIGSADGSQIYPDKKYGLPIAVVQIGSVRNRHTEESEYAQSTSATLIMPDAFADAEVYAFSKGVCGC